MESRGNNTAPILAHYSPQVSIFGNYLLPLQNIFNFHLYSQLTHNHIYCPFRAIRNTTETTVEGHWLIYVNFERGLSFLKTQDYEKYFQLFQHYIILISSIMASLFLRHLMLVISILNTAMSATIIVTTIPSGPLKCYGNFIANGLKCLPCNTGQIAQNNKCVKLTLPGYGSNLNIMQNPNFQLQNCVRVNPQNSSNCDECRKSYDVISGRCVPQSCRMYSQVLNQCLDSMKQSDLQSVVAQNTGSAPANKPAQQIYIIGGPMSKMEVISSDNTIALALPTFALVYGSKQLQKTEISTEIPINPRPLPITITVGCAVYSDKQCSKCYVGYFLNMLSSECVLISPFIPLQDQPPNNQL